MAIMDIFNDPTSTTSQALADNPQTLSVLGNIVNSPELQTAVQQQSEPSTMDSVLGFLKSAATGLGKAASDPSTINSLRAFGSAMDNDKAGYDANMNAYSQRMAEKQEQEKQQEAIKAQQSQKDNLAYFQALYDIYTPESVAMYRSTGNPASLVKNAKTLKQEQETALEDRKVAATEAGVGIQRDNADTQRLSALQTGSYQNAQLDQAAKKLAEDTARWNAEQGNKGFDGITLSDGTTVNSAGRYTTKDGQSVDVARDGNGLHITPTKDKDKPAGENGTSRIINNDLSLVNSALAGKLPNADIGSFTGQVDSRVPIVSDLQTSIKGGDTRKVYDAVKRINANTQNMGIAEAKAMGASGINTLAEAERFSAGMPHIDTTSVDNMRNSVQNLQSYINKFKAPEPTNNASNTDTDRIIRRNPNDGKLYYLERNASGKYVPVGEY